MLNNIENCRQCVYDLFDAMGLDDLTIVISNKKAQRKTSKGQRENPNQIAKTHVFLINILSAENLAACDNNGLSDPFVTVRSMQVENSIELARTKVIKKSLNPHWDESFEFFLEYNYQEIEQGHVLEFVVSDKDVWTDEECGRAYLSMKLDKYSDGLMHDET